MQTTRKGCQLGSRGQDLRDECDDGRIYLPVEINVILFTMRKGSGSHQQH